MKKMAENKITIIGGGNGGLTAAYHFTKIGNNVCLYDSMEYSTNIFGVINNSNSIEALGDVDGMNCDMPGKETIDRITTSIEEAMNYSKIVVLIVPSYAQEIIFNQLYKYLDDHILVTMPGNFASLTYNNILKNKGIERKAVFVDAISIPWACRIECEGGVAIYGTKTHLPLGVFPAKYGKETISKLEKIFPLPLKLLDNVMAAGMENINFGGHPLLSVLNMGIMENFDGKFNYYKDTCSIATSKAVSVMEDERIALGKVIGVDVTPELEAMNTLYNTEYASVYELNRSSSAHSKIGAPSNSQHRYITEDVPYLLVPCYSLAKAVGLETPMMYSCITIAGAYNGKNYFDRGRNLEDMGIEGLSKNEIMTYLENGIK